MNSYLWIRSVIRASACAATLLAATSLAAAASRVQAQAELLDQAEFRCANCLFGASEHYYCFAAGPLVLVGYQKTPVVNWHDDSKNYLTLLYPRWANWTPPVDTVKISYDDKHIWVDRTEDRQIRRTFWTPLKSIRRLIVGDNKALRLRRRSSPGIFMNNDRCRGSDLPKAQ